MTDAIVGIDLGTTNSEIAIYRDGRPVVLTDERGPDHRRLFRVAVEIHTAEGVITALAESEGSTKKRAQQEAARLALSQLELHTHPRSGRQVPSSEEAS